MVHVSVGYYHHLQWSYQNQISENITKALQLLSMPGQQLMRTDRKNHNVNFPQRTGNVFLWSKRTQGWWKISLERQIQSLLVTMIHHHIIRHRPRAIPQIKKKKSGTDISTQNQIIYLRLHLRHPPHLIVSTRCSRLQPHIHLQSTMTNQPTTRGPDNPGPKDSIRAPVPVALVHKLLHLKQTHLQISVHGTSQASITSPMDHISPLAIVIHTLHCPIAIPLRPSFSNRSSKQTPMMRMRILLIRWPKPSRRCLRSSVRMVVHLRREELGVRKRQNERVDSGEVPVKLVRLSRASLVRSLMCRVNDALLELQSGNETISFVRTAYGL